MRASAKELIAICDRLLQQIVRSAEILQESAVENKTYSFFSLLPQSVKLLPVLCEFAAKVLYPFKCLLLLRGYKFFLGQRRVVIDRS